MEFHASPSTKYHTEGAAKKTDMDGGTNLLWKYYAAPTSVFPWTARYRGHRTLRRIKTIKQETSSISHLNIQIPKSTNRVTSQWGEEKEVEVEFSPKKCTQFIL